LALAGLVVFGLARGCFDANHMPIVRKLTDQRLSAAAFGLLNFISCAAGGLMTYAGGLVMDAQMNLGVVFLAVALGLLALGLLLLLIRPRHSPAVPADPNSLEPKPSCTTQN
jgi:hypothetical protein